MQQKATVIEILNLNPISGAATEARLGLPSSEHTCEDPTEVLRQYVNDSQLCKALQLTDNF